MRYIYTLIAATLVGGVLSACGSSSGSDDGSDKPIVIGASVSKTGAYSGSAKYALQGTELAIKDINEAGGLSGRKVELVVYDDQSDPATAVKLYTKLISQDKADLLIGPYSSAITEAVAPLAEKFEIPMIDPEGAAASIYKDKKYNFQAIAVASTYFEDIPKIAKSKGYKSLALFQNNQTLTNAACDALKKDAKDAGMDIVFSETYPEDTAEFSSLVLRAKQANPDVVVGCTYEPDAIGLTRALNNQGLAPKMVAMSIGPVEEEFGSSLGDVANGVLGSTQWWPTLKTEGNKEFVSDFKAEFGRAPDYHSALNYGAVEVLQAAVKEAKSFDNAKIAKALRGIEMETVVGTFRVSDDGVQIGYGGYLMQWQNGEQKLVYPEDVAEADMKLPYK